MVKTYTEIVDDAEALLQDSSNAVFTATEFDTLMPEGLVAVSFARPWEYKITKTTTADSYDISLSTGDLWRLLKGTGYNGTGIVKVEYEVDQNPREFRGLTEFAGTISLELDSRPSSAVNVYLFMNKIHLLQKAIGTTDTAAAISTAAAVGATSLVLKNLGTGTINEMTYLAIAGDSTVYVAIAESTIAANVATVSIWPPLAAAAALDAVVTLSLVGSTLDTILENYLARWLAAKAAISKSTKSYAQVDTAITTIANAATAISAIAARITAGVADIASGRTSAFLGATAITNVAARIAQAITDISSGRTEAAKVSAILDTTNTQIDLIIDSLNQAKVALIVGGAEADKVPAIVRTAATAIGLVDARISQALTDIVSARTAISKGTGSLANANTQMGLSDAQVDLAVTALSTGSSLINTVTVGGGAKEYMEQANSDVNVAQGFVASGRGYIEKAIGDFNNATPDFVAATRELEAGAMRIREAQASLEQSNIDLAVNRADIEQAASHMRIAQGLFQQASGYVMEANNRMANNATYIQTAMAEIRAGDARITEAGADHANAASYYAAAAEEFRAAAVKAQEAVTNLNLVASRMQVSAGGLRYEEWGRRELASVEQALRSMTTFRHSVRYPRD